MKLRLTYLQPTGSAVDIGVTVDSEAPIAALAEALARRDPSGGGEPGGAITLARYDESGRPAPVPGTTLVGEAGIRSGSMIALTADSAPRAASDAIGAVLTVHGGPDAGATFDLGFGATVVGRGAECPIRLSDPMVSTHHARINVADEIEIIDENSSNGLLVGGELVPRVTLRPGDRVVLGESTITVESRRAAPIGIAPLSPTVAFNRSPRVDPAYPGGEFIAPEPPSPPEPQRFPMISALVPLLMGVGVFAVTGNPFSVVFVLFSPLMLVGGYFQNKRWARQSLEEAVRNFRANLADLVVDLRTEADEERRRRSIEHPGAAEVVQAIDSTNPLMWTRRPEHDSFMELRLGLGVQPSRTKVNSANSRNSLPELYAELVTVVDEFALVDRVPVVGSFLVSGNVGVSGPDEGMLGVARGLLIQLVGLHSPAELVIVAVASARSAGRWEWLKWLPHAASDHSPISGEHLVATAPGCSNLVSELTDLVQLRSADDSGLGAATPDLPRIVVVVEDDAPVARSRLVHLAEVGPEVGVHLVWTAASTSGIPAACRSFVEVDPSSGSAATGRVVEGEFVVPVLIEPLDSVNAERLARSLAPVVDSGALVNDESDVPSSVSFLADAGVAIATEPASIIDRWRESNSLVGQRVGTQRLKRDNSLRALVGHTATDLLHLDLRAQGPHALVGGTTGSGKSEFLQTWILGMATAHSPQRVTFLFVDYKGGSAFADCVNLPHSVGLVTDLSPHLVQRALMSLNAELRYREHVLNRKKAKDLLELERRNDPEAPPSLVIVIDEFAALVQEVPEFVDGVVNVAQRGRSLGLHLILATQRPAGVIKDNLRANTNLRIALRMADEEDSRDVVGTPQAGTFDPEIPGRGVAKTGPGRLSLFQAAYVGGWTTDEAPPPAISVRTLVFGPGVEWDPVEVGAAVAEEDPGPPDIHRIVSTVRSASEAAKLPQPRKPWLPELASTYDLAELPLPRKDSELVLGVADRPEAQEQQTLAFRPDLDGNLAVFGTGGSGKSALLRTLGVGAGLTARGGPCFVYGLDFGSRGLTMLETLPHVGSIVGADDVERTARLVAQLHATVDERAVRYAKVNAGTIDEYRTLANAPEEPRVLLLLDGFSAFRSAYEVGPVSGLFDELIGVAADGRPVGVHVAFSADRLGVVPSSLVASVQQKVALRVSNEMDESMLGIPKGGFGEAPPPGRGFIDGTEVQIAVLGGSQDVAAQAASIERLAESMRRANAPQAPPIERLPETVALDQLPATVDGLPTFGVSDATLGPIGFDPSGVLLVAGPSGSGRSTAVVTMLGSLRQQRPDLNVVYFGHRRSPLAAMEWSQSAVGTEQALLLANEIVAAWQAEETPAQDTVVVLDGVGQFLNSEADLALQELLKLCRAMGVFVLAEGETSDIAGSWPLLQALKASRHGIVLQPDQMDGDTLFRTSFPKMSRADFPVGRGVYVHRGKFQRLQIALM